jgi:hypothetical protein
MIDSLRLRQSPVAIDLHRLITGTVNSVKFLTLWALILDHPIDHVTGCLQE